jgi:hypothetical protein
MLSLEVVGPGDGLSTAPSATPYWRDASWRSWQAVTATAAYSCDRAVAVLLLWLGNGWRWRRRGGTGSDGDGLKISIFLYFYIRPFNRIYRILICLYSAFPTIYLAS